MSEAHIEEKGAARRRRVQRLKRVILIILIAAMILPTVLCIYLMGKTTRLGKQIEELRDLISAAAEQPESFREEVLKSGEETAKQETPKQDTSDGEEPETEEVKIRNVYLTFDDGPGVYTDEILDILQEYEVKASFFVTGKSGEEYERLYRRIVEEGHTLGMHSYSHKYSEVYASRENFEEDYRKLHDYLYEVTGTDSKFYRFPGGSSNTVSKVDMDELISFLTEEGITYFDWNISSGDASGSGLSAEQIVDNCTINVENYNSAFILLHDAKEKRTTVDALPQIIEKILAMENTQIVPITDETGPVQHRKN